MPDIVIGVKGDLQMSSQSTAFRRTVAERMAAYEDRIASRIRRQMELHGEDPADLAYKLSLNPRTPERWINEGVVPQPRQFRALAKHWKIPVAELKPDLEKEEKALADQLDRIEEKLDEILKRLPAEIREGDGGLDDAEREAEQTSQDDQRSAQDADRSANQDQARQRESGAG